jgi:hypothetical protein
MHSVALFITETEAEESVIYCKFIEGKKAKFAAGLN